MRDDHRIKEKYELSLDNRQVVSFFVAGIVVIGTVFLLGVVVGKKLAASYGASNSADLLSALDEKAARLDQVKTAPPSEPRLTFQEELTKKPAAVPPKEAAPAMDPAPTVESVPDSRNAASGEEPRPASEPIKPEPTREKLKQAIARIEKPIAEPTARGGGAFTLQLSASQQRDDADRFAAQLRAKGYEPYVVESDVKDRGRWYRVRMGKFSSRDAAAKYLEDFRRETRLPAFVTSAN